MTQTEWPKRLTEAIADQVQKLRGHRGMSAQQLADATAALGHAVPRSVIANLESGRRDTVSVAELLVLAKALRVPPLLLVFPLGEQQMTEVLPDTTVGTWTGAKWFSGEAPFPVLMPDGKWAAADFDEWRDAATTYFREQDRLFDQWNRSRRAVTAARRKASEIQETPAKGGFRLAPDAYINEAEVHQEVLLGIEDQLRRHRELMRRVGLDPGALTADLAHVDEATGIDDGER